MLLAAQLFQQIILGLCCLFSYFSPGFQERWFDFVCFFFFTDTADVNIILYFLLYLFQSKVLKATCTTAKLRNTTTQFVWLIFSE